MIDAMDPTAHAAVTRQPRELFDFSRDLGQLALAATQARSRARKHKRKRKVGRKLNAAERDLAGAVVAAMKEAAPDSSQIQREEFVALVLRIVASKASAREVLRKPRKRVGKSSRGL
jgi:hypothetical protein